MSNGSIILTIARHEYAVNVRRAGFIFFTLLIPALGLIGLVGIALFSGQALRSLGPSFDSAIGNSNHPTGLIDQTGLFTPLPANFDEDFRLYTDEPAARTALLAGELNGYVVIPADYVATGEVTGYSVGGLLDAANVDSDTLRELLVYGLLAGHVDDATFKRVNDPVDLTPVMLNPSGQPTAPPKNIGSVVAGFLIPYALSIFLIISIFTGSSYLLRSVAEEKETRVIEVGAVVRLGHAVAHWQGARFWARWG